MMSTDLEERLRSAFEHRAATTVVTNDESISMDRPARGRVTTPAFIGIAAALVVGGLVVSALVRTSESERPASLPSLPVDDLVVSDLLAIDLDGLPATSVASTSKYMVVDRAALPDGWSLSDESGYTKLELVGGGYGYSATVTVPSGDRFTVDVRSSAPVCDPSTLSADDVPVDAHEVSVFEDRIEWYPSSTLTIGVGSAFATEADLRAVAASLAFVAADHLPTPRIGTLVPGEPVDPEIAGVLDGLPWTAEIEPSALRTVRMTLGGRRFGGFENDRDSQPDDTPATTVDATISGIPGYGALVFGYAPPSVAGLRLETVAGSVDLPVFRRTGESWFAFPIPRGLVATSFTLLLDDGSDGRSYVIPSIPDGLGGTYGGAISG